MKRITSYLHYLAQDVWANFKVQRAVNLLSLFIVIFTFFVIDIFFLTKVNLDKLTAKTLTGFQVEAYFGSPLRKISRRGASPGAGRKRSKRRS